MSASRAAIPRRGAVAVVGPGRLGTVLAAGLERAGHDVVAALGRGAPSLARFGSRFPAARTSQDPAVVVGSELVVVATPDDAVPAVVRDLVRADALGEGQAVVHVAGSLGLAVLHPAALSGCRTAACHPAQTVPAADADPAVLEGAAWAVTAAPSDLGWARDLVEQLGGRPHDVADDRRVLYHAALTVGSNAVGGVVSLARRLLLASGVDAPGDFLSPLVAASVDNVVAGGAAAITGPVVRGDVGTVRRHLEALEADLPEAAASYRVLSRAVLDQVRPGMDAGVARAMDTALGDGA